MPTREFQTGSIISAVCGLLTVIGAAFLAAISEGYIIYDTWPVFLAVTAIGVIGFWLALLWLGQQQKLYRRLQHEVRVAHQQALFTTEADLEKYAAKKFVDILRHEEEQLIAKHRLYYADPDWIEYLEDHGELGGQVVLDYYAEPMRLVRAARRVDANTSWEDQKVISTQQALTVAEVGEVGEELIRQKLADMQQPEAPEALPWQEAL